MARTCGNGVSYFPLDCTMDVNVEILEATFGLEGFAVLIKLWQAIYRDKGFYMIWDADTCLLSAHKWGLTVERLQQIVDLCIARGLFDEEMYTNKGILTSAGIQNRYAEIVERRKQVSINSDLVMTCTKLHTIIAYNNALIACNCTQSKVKESKVKERNKDSCADALEGESENVDRFDAFWEAYPKKIGKGYAEKSFKKLCKNRETFEAIMKALEVVKQSEQWQRQGGQFIPYPSTWLNQERWRDEVEEKPKEQAGKVEWV